MTPPRCPRCERSEMEECCEMQEASDRTESFPASHRCKKCHFPFRYTPPAGELAPKENACPQS